MDAQVIRIGGYQGPASVHNRATYVLGEGLVDKTGGETSADADRGRDEARPQLARPLRHGRGQRTRRLLFRLELSGPSRPQPRRLRPALRHRDRETIYRLLDNGLGEEIKADVAERTGFTVLGFWDNGFRHFTNRLRPIRTPEDCKGLSIRTMNSVIHQETFRALGFQPDFIDIKDYPTAVRTGVVDAQENPLTNTVNFAVHETHPYLTMTGHFYGTSLVLGNAERIAAWPKDQREAFDAAMQEATVAQRRFANEEDERCFPILAAAGVEVIRPGDFDRPAFEKATAGVSAATAEQIDDSVMRFFKQ